MITTPNARYPCLKRVLGESVSTTDFAGDFGANEWLVDEMYEKYLANPNSVDDQWKTLFASGAHTPGGQGASTSAQTPSASAPTSPIQGTQALQLPPGLTLPASGGRPPAPKSASAIHVTGNGNGVSAASASVPSASAPATPAPATPARRNRAY